MEREYSLSLSLSFIIPRPTLKSQGPTNGLISMQKIFFNENLEPGKNNSFGTVKTVRQTEDSTLGSNLMTLWWT